jgi:SAM-dependent methyltransferase
MEREYDKVISQHYQNAAAEHGLSASSTMEDHVTRKLETDAILLIAGTLLNSRKTGGAPRRATILDIGCGNGYTLEMLFRSYPDQQFVGIEKSDELRALACRRFEGNESVRIMQGDAREHDFAKGLLADMVICQRVLINLLNPEDQKLALNNIIDAARPPRDGRQSGGALLFIECFASNLARLNVARLELDLPPIPPAYHNLYLPDDFFATRGLRPLETTEPLPAPNFLSTHYFVSRVFFPFASRGKAFKRNSEFVNFFSAALKQDVGDYSPLKLYVFEKTARD